VGAQGDAALAAADDHDVGLLGDPEPGFLLLAVLPPAHPAGIRAVPHALRAGQPARLLMPGELLQGRQQRPALPARQPEVAVAAAHGGLEVDPRLGHAARLGGLLARRDPPAVRRHPRQHRLEHRRDLVAAFHRLDVPGECHQVTPVAFRREQGRRGRRIAGRQRVPEGREPGRDRRGGRG
jgi:hypothetical protein